MSIQNPIINKSIDFIIDHLTDDLTLDTIADHCNFSKYYFNRLFKSATGESVYAFIKRLRMERSAFLLAVERDRSITDIGLDYGYSASNFSTAFKKYLNLSPYQFKQQRTHQSTIYNPFSAHDVKFHDYEYYNDRITIQKLPEYTILFQRHIGNYLEFGDVWPHFMARYQDMTDEETVFVERSYDNPTVTDVNRCIYEVGFIVDPATKGDHIMVLPGGLYAMFRFEGGKMDIFPAYQGIFQVWLPQSGYAMTGRIGMDLYRSCDVEGDHFVMDICVPIQR